MTSTYLTKSLHTVTAVSRVAAMHYSVSGGSAKQAVKMALETLGQAGPWPKDDPTVDAAMRATKRITGGK